MRSLIAPSILSADFASLGEEVQNVLDAGADVIHFDVMDNHYVPNLTIGPLVLDALKKRCPTAIMDVHLMVKPVESMIEAFGRAGADYISIHPETTEHAHAALARIRALGAKAGLVLNPDTPPSTLDYLVDVVDLVLVMSVNPGFGGQQFIDGSLEKVEAVRQRLDTVSRPVRLEIDGGIKVANIGEARAAGADMFVAGSAIFEAPDYADVIAAMRTEIDRVERTV